MALMQQPRIWAESGHGRGSAGRGLIVFFQDVERVAAMQLHADGAQNCADRTGGAALLADDLANILRCHPQPQDGVLVPADGLDLDG